MDQKPNKSSTKGLRMRPFFGVALTAVIALSVVFVPIAHADNAENAAAILNAIQQLMKEIAGLQSQLQVMHANTGAVSTEINNSLPTGWNSFYGTGSSNGNSVPVTASVTVSPTVVPVGTNPIPTTPA